MRKIFLIFSIIMCFPSLNHNLISSRLIRNKTNHGGSSKINTKAYRRLNPNKKYYHSISTAPWTTEELKRSISKPIYYNWNFMMHHNPRRAEDYFHHLRRRRKYTSPNQFYDKHIRGIREINRVEVLDEVTNATSAPTLNYDMIPKTGNKLEKTVDDLHQMQSFRVPHNPRRVEYSHQFRHKRRDISPNQFHTKHIRDIRETNRDIVLDDEEIAARRPTQTYDIRPRTESELEKAADELQQMRLLLKNIDKKISSLSDEVKYENSKYKNIHPSISSEIRRRQSNVVQSSLPAQMVETLMPNKPINEIPKDAKLIPITPGDPLLEISQILSLLPQNKESKDQPITNSKQMGLSPNVALQNGNRDPSYLKSVLNMSLQTMDKEQTLEFVANALLNNDNFIELLAKNMYLNQRNADNRPVRSVNESVNSYTGEFVTLIILFIISLILIIIIVVWHFLGNPWLSPSASISSGTGTTTTTRRSEEKKPSSKTVKLSEETESSLDIPHMSLKNMIRKSVFNTTNHSKEEATRNLIKRTGNEDYISVEGFKKWNNNWKVPDKNSKTDSTDVKRKSRIHSDSEIYDETMGQKNRIPKMSEVGRKESTPSSTLDDVMSPAIVVGGDPEIALSKKKALDNVGLSEGASDLLR